MAATTGPQQSVEIEDLAQLDALVASGAHSMRGWRFQALDLTDHGAVLRRLDPAGSVFLGVRLHPDDERSLRDRGALIFPTVPDVPFDPYRATLYTPDELYQGLGDGYAATPDARIYAWSRAPRTLDSTLAQALHDLAIDDALEEYVEGRSCVGVMGGHAARRGTPAFATAARLGKELSGRGLLVCTGGGPGAMEAASLGSRAAHLPGAELDRALAALGQADDFRHVEEWARAAFAVREWLDDGDCLGIPTWFYGHEPPNVFASRVAKYFRNALREDTLLRIATAGVVFLPGAAGTVQEIFADACENYYGSPVTRAPMVLVDRAHWTGHLPAWPLLRRLAEEADMTAQVHLVDTVDEACALLG